MHLLFLLLKVTTPRKNDIVQECYLLLSSHPDEKWKAEAFTDKSLPPTDKELQKADCGCILPNQFSNAFFDETIYFEVKNNYNLIVWKCSLYFLP